MTLRLALLLAALLGTSIHAVSAESPACMPPTYELEDGLTYYKVPVTKLDGRVEYLDIEVGPLRFLYCNESPSEDIVLMTCAVMDDTGMAGIATFARPLAKGEKAAAPEAPHTDRRTPRLPPNQT